MNLKQFSMLATSTVLIIGLTLFDLGCKKDESPTSPGGGGGLMTFSFGTAGQTLTIPASGGAVRVRLIGGTLPYTITGSPNPSVAATALNYDTLTVIPVSQGTTSITITDSLGALIDRVVTLGITVTGSSGGSYGSGTVTATSSAGNLSFTGTGVWPLQAGPSVLAVYDTSFMTGAFFIFGYQRVSGPNYNMVFLVAFMPGGVATGTYNYPQITVGAAYNVDTTNQSDSVAYQSVSGSIIVTSVSGSNAVGTYSVMARKGTGPAIQFTGTFNVTYVVGTMPEDRSRSVHRGASGHPHPGRPNRVAKI